MKPFAILFLSGIALAFSLSVENVYHSKQKRSGIIHIIANNCNCKLDEFILKQKIKLNFIDTLKILDAIKQVHLFYFILSASPQLTIVPPNLNDPATVAVGGAAAIGGGLLLNHLFGDPAGKAIGNLLEGN